MLQDDFFFSRLQSEKVDFFLELLKKWQKKINLVSSASVEDLRVRHVYDSAQLCRCLHFQDIVLDVGSGAGFPGIILSIVGGQPIHLLEPSLKKHAFLQEVILKLSLNARLYPERIEHFFPTFVPTVLTARGLASVEKIFSLSERLLTPALRYVLLKGQSFEQEIEEASLKWNFEVEIFPSITHPLGKVLVFSKVFPKND